MMMMLMLMMMMMKMLIQGDKLRPHDDESNKELPAKCSICLGRFHLSMMMIIMVVMMIITAIIKIIIIDKWKWPEH